MRLRYPLKKIKITQEFGERPKVYKPWAGHMGIDFRTRALDNLSGKQSVYAAAGGRVIIGNQGGKGYGKFVKIRHEDGSETIYAHLSEWTVKNNDRVCAGRRIGISGNTGFSSAPHLHFGYRPPGYNPHDEFNGYVNPLPYMSDKLEAPYFEKIKGKSTICSLDPVSGKLVPINDGIILKMMFGSYDNVNINEVEKWSCEVANEEIFKR